MSVRRIIHVDMDAFYASVEQRDRPELRGRPVIVAGSDASRGVVAAASYEARRFGVHSAMPTARAMRLCPDVVRVPVRMSRYKEVSGQIREVFLSYTHLVEPIALDECFLDISEWCEEKGCTATEVALAIKARIRAETGLTASAGVGPNKFVAKVASDVRKPDGLTVVHPDRVIPFLHRLPVDRIWGVGPKTAARLRELNVNTVAQLAECELTWLVSHFGKAGHAFHQLAQGIDRRSVVPFRQPKSLSTEETFAQDVIDPAALSDVLRSQSEEVAGRLARHRLTGTTVVLKLRYDDFTTVTRSHTCEQPLGSPEVIFELAGELLSRTEFPQRPVRLVGVGVSGLVENDRPLQLTLF